MTCRATDLDSQIAFLKRNTAGTRVFQLMDDADEGTPAEGLGAADEIRLRVWDRRTRDVVIDAELALTDAETALVTWAFTSNDTANAGDFEGEIHEIVDDVSRRVFPAHGRFPLVIESEIPALSS